MGRKVFVTSDMSIDERLLDIAEQNPIIALMWPWFITALDDWGRAEASAKRLKASVFPGIGIVTPDLIDDAMSLYAQVGLVLLYEVDDKRYFCVETSKWFKWQTHIRATKREKDESKYPAFSKESQVEAPARKCAQMREDARKIQPSPSPSPSPSKEGIGEGNGEGGTPPSDTDWIPCLRKEDRRKPIMEGITNALAPYARLINPKEHSKILELLEAHCQFMYKRDWCHYPPECLQFFSVVCDKFKIAVEREGENGKSIRSVPALLEAIYAEELGKWGDQFSRTAKSLT